MKEAKDRALGLSTLKRVFCSIPPQTPRSRRPWKTASAALKDYVMPHESERMKAATGGKMSTMLGKLLILRARGSLPRQEVTLIFVREAAGD